MRYWDIKTPPNTEHELWERWMNAWAARTFPKLTIAKKIEVQNG